MSPITLARCTTTASDYDEELNSLLEKLDSLLERLNSLGEVLVAEWRLQVPSCALVVPSEVPVLSSLATLQEGQKGLDHGVRALEETSRMAKVLLLVTAAWGLQVHQVVPWYRLLWQWRPIAGQWQFGSLATAVWVSSRSIHDFQSLHSHQVHQGERSLGRGRPCAGKLQTFPCTLTEQRKVPVSEGQLHVPPCAMAAMGRRALL